MIINMYLNLSLHVVIKTFLNETISPISDCDEFSS